MTHLGIKDPQSVEGPLKYAGVFRGFVEDVVDPDRRGRVRVRIPSVHADTTPTEHLAWAERVFPDGGHADAGQYHPVQAGRFSGKDGRHTGDAVLVMFEGGDIAMPLVIGFYYAAPDAVSEVPSEVQRDNYGHSRRHIVKSRHGHRVEIGDERSDYEIKIVSARGDVVQIREADGGRGFHVTTAEGHKLSMQDEHPGVSGDETLTAYDQDPDVGYTPRSEVKNDRIVTLAPQERTIQIPDRKDADGVVKSSTPGVASGFGQRGVLLETSGGHKIQMRDVTDPGVSIITNDGHFMEFLDSPNEIRVRTAGGQYVEWLDASNTINIVAGGDVTVNAGGTIAMTAGESITMTAPSIGIYATDFYGQLGSGVIDVSGTIDWNFI